MELSPEETISEVQQALSGQACWYVSCGGSAGGSFKLAFGRRIRRERPLKNRAHTEEFRTFEGEVGLLVWCAWRLDGASAPILSADEGPARIGTDLPPELVGASIVDVAIELPGWDLVLGFSNGKTLRVFCDYVSKEGTFDTNWELVCPDFRMLVRAGSIVEFE